MKAFLSLLVLLIPTYLFAQEASVTCGSKHEAIISKYHQEIKKLGCQDSADQKDCDQLALPSVMLKMQEEVARELKGCETVFCPSGYIPISADKDLGLGDFCVMKYEGKKDGGKIVSMAEGAPLTKIDACVSS